MPGPVIMARGSPDEAQALLLRRKLLHTLDQPVCVAGQACRVGLAIGFVLVPHGGTHADALIKPADAAMDAAKQAGRHTMRRVGAPAGLTFSS